MQTKIETQHLDSVEFVVFDAENDEFLGEDDIQDFVDQNDSKLVAKAICEAMRTFTYDLKEALRKELIDCYKEKTNGD